MKKKKETKKIIIKIKLLKDLEVNDLKMNRIKFAVNSKQTNRQDFLYCNFITIVNFVRKYIFSKN